MPDRDNACGLAARRWPAGYGKCDGIKMRIPILLIIALLLPRPLPAVEIGNYEVNVERKNQHPFLVDHNRILVISKRGKMLDKFTLYPDPGARVPLHVFEDQKGLIFIDCNGYWLSINKETEKINKMGWFWMKPVPDKYLGTFRLRKEDKEHSFKKEANTTEKQVYLYKDP